MSDTTAAERTHPDEATSSFVEECGLVFEASGGPRASGRMLGWLMVCDPPEQSAEQLAAALRASSGGVSTTARWLVRAGYVERVTRAGDRRTYYRMRAKAWTRSLDDQQAVMRGFRELADSGLAVLDGAPAASRERLDDMRDFFSFMEERFPALAQDYHERPSHER